MSKLIVEMEMPKRCINCGVRLKCKRYVCGLQQDIAEDLKPLIGDKDCLIKGELPEEHGDLIDRDVSIQTFKCIEEAPYSGFDGQESFYTPEDVVSTLLCQDVVIAAERKDDEQIH